MGDAELEKLKEQWAKEDFDLWNSPFERDSREWYYTMDDELSKERLEKMKEKYPPKYKVGEKVTCTGWGGSTAYAKVKNICPIYHSRLYRWTWGMSLDIIKGEHGLTFIFVPQGYLEKWEGDEEDE